MEPIGIMKNKNTRTRSFAIMPGETELEGVLRTSRIMGNILFDNDFLIPTIDSTFEQALLPYSLIEEYVKLYKSLPESELMFYLLKYPEVANVYNKIKEITERPHYKGWILLRNAGHSAFE